MIIQVIKDTGCILLKCLILKHFNVFVIKGGGGFLKA